MNCHENEFVHRFVLKTDESVIFDPELTGDFESIYSNCKLNESDVIAMKTIRTEMIVYSCCDLLMRV